MPPMRDKMVASNSSQKTVQINLRNVIGNYEDEDEEQNDIIVYLNTQIKPHLLQPLKHLELLLKMWVK